MVQMAVLEVLLEEILKISENGYQAEVVQERIQAHRVVSNLDPSDDLDLDLDLEQRLARMADADLWDHLEEKERQGVQDTWQSWICSLLATPCAELLPGPLPLADLDLRDDSN
jgi:hypothetical protein